MATASKKPRSKSSARRAPPAKSAVAKRAPARSTKPAGPVTKKPTGKRAAAPKARAADEPERASAPLAEVDAEVLEFIAAIDTFKRQHGRPFPSWSEVLLIVHHLGYRRD